MSRSAHIYWLIVCSLILLMLDHFLLLQFFKNSTDQVIVPTKSFFYTLRTSAINSTDLLTHYDQIKQFAKQQTKLNQENEELKYSLSQLQDENKKLRAQLEAPAFHAAALIPVSVIGIQQTMEIAGGSSDGIKIGMTVISGVSCIGKITSVTERRSQVQLLTDPDVSMAGRTSRGTGGNITGQPGGVMVMDKVLQKDPLFLDDQVVTSGDMMTPPNLLIGKIVHINASDVAVYKQAKIRPSVDYTKLETVFIIRLP